MTRTRWFWGPALSAALLTGCVERSFIVTSDPPGAIVLRNNQPIGATPADDHFVYYGKYHFTLIRDGYETLQVDENISTPWYEYWPLDFVSENLVPWEIHDVRRLHYQLTPLQAVRTDELLQEAQRVREVGRGIVPPPPPRNSAPYPGPVTPAPPPQDLPR